MHVARAAEFKAVIPEPPLVAVSGYKQQPEPKGRLLISKLPITERDLQYSEGLKSARSRLLEK